MWVVLRIRLRTMGGFQVNRDTLGGLDEYLTTDVNNYDPDPDEECYQCGGEGWITGECFEDTCCCANPEEDHDMIPCPVCSGHRN